MVKPIPLLGGAYSARSVIASAQRCVNLFPEKNPGDSEMPTTHYPTPGLVQLSVPPVQGPGRGLYWASNGDLYAVVGKSVYYVDGQFTFNLLGTIGTSSGPVYLADNTIDILLVDGSASGYTIHLASRAFATVVDGNFLGGDRVDYVDTFLVNNIPNTNQWQSSLSNSVAWDPTYIAAKVGASDKLAALMVTHREIWLLGSQYSTEVWADYGNANFPFAIINGVFIQYGCAAKYSVAYNGLELFWLSQDKNGQAFVLMGKPYAATVISTPAITQEFNRYAKLSDAIGFCYQQDGHVFYVLTFPTQDVTWVYDASTGQWHEWLSIDANGQEHRCRIAAMAFAYGKNLGLDWQTGALHWINVNTFTENGLPIIRRRSFPHIVLGGQRVNYKYFSADIETGNILVDDPNLLTLRWSDDRGHSWRNPVVQSMGRTGNYIKQPTWYRLGQARDRVFELYWSTPAMAALNGAYIDFLPSVS